MRQFILAISIVAALVSSSLWANSSPAPQGPLPIAARAEETVYVTKTGKKYHKAGCRHLSKSSIDMKLEEARKRFSPCSVCKPPM